MTATRKHSFWRSLLKWTLTLITAVTALGTLAGAFGGDFPPSRYRYLCLMVMTFPAWVAALTLVTIFDALWCRKALLISLIAFIPSAPAIWNFFPLNIFTPSESKYAGCPKFTLLTWNVLNFMPQDTVYPDGLNPTLSFILKTDADICCLQEASGFIPIRKYIKIPGSQIDSISKRYPYVLLCERSQMVLSKYPAKVIPTGYKSIKANEIAAVRVTVDGTDITIFNVHLESFDLDSDDISLYSDITGGERRDMSLRNNLSEIRSQLLYKIQQAAENRERNAERLGSYITRLGGPNAIVTGDFNDVPGCYTLRRLADYDFHEVYPAVGFGPRITYNANRFYFRIDHTLWRGDLEPLSMTRPSTRSSDHYPQITTFAITAPKK